MKHFEFKSLASPYNKALEERIAKGEFPMKKDEWSYFCKIDTKPCRKTTIPIGYSPAIEKRIKRGI